MNGWLDVMTNEWMNGWNDNRMDEWMEWKMNGWMHETVSFHWWVPRVVEIVFQKYKFKYF